jgi:hypothetical protein
MRRALLLATALLLARAADADPDPDSEARRLFDVGNKAYDAGRYEDALKDYQQAFALVPRPNLLFNIAKTFQQLGDETDAWAAYHDFLDNAETTNPHFSEAEEAMHSLEPKVLVDLDVNTTPHGAAVFLDDEPKPRAVTPATLKIPPGAHRLVFRLEGYRAEPERFDINIGDKGDISATLIRLGHLHIDGGPGSTVRLPDVPGADALPSPVDIDLAPGNYIAWITRPGSEDVEIEPNVKSGETTTKTVTLRAQGTAPLEVDGPAGALVYVDALPVGHVPFVGDVSSGEHGVLVEQGGSSWSDRIDLDPMHITHLDVSLGPSHRTARAVAWGIGGAGVLSAAIGLTVGALALDAKSSFNAMPTQALYDRATNDARAADVLIGVGALAVGTALLLHHAGHPMPSTGTVTTRDIQ